jgi:hypothetical protein
MQQQSLHKKGKESSAYLDPQMVMRTHIHLGRKDIVAYFVKSTSHYKDKEMLVVLFNMDSHWVTLSVSTMYEHVWYCDSSRPINPKIGDRLTHDFSDVMYILDE